jgi:hypothetical protein
MMRTELVRFNGAVERDPAIDVWMKEHAGKLGAIARVQNTRVTPIKALKTPFYAALLICAAIIAFVLRVFENKVADSEIARHPFELGLGCRRAGGY